MEVKFTGKIAEIESRADEWIEAHPGVKIVWRSAPIRVGHSDGEDIFDKADWTITIEYSESPNGRD